MVTARRATPEFLPDEQVVAGQIPAEPARAEEGPGVGKASVGVPTDWRNPTFGPEYWMLGAAAALPAFLLALALLAAAGMLPLAPRLPVGLALGVVLLLLAIGAVAAHVVDYPAWSHPAIVLIPTLLLFLPVAVLRGQAVARLNGDPDPVILVPLAICWLLLCAATMTIAIVAVVLGRRAPSFSGVALLPLPLTLAWLLILAPPFREQAVTGALGTALALVAFATFAAWIAPTNLRPLVPLAAIAAQFGIFWLQRFHWPVFNGALRPLIGLDIALYVGLVGLVAVAPLLATWVRRAAWPAVEQMLD